jgi:hypothetical protein
VSEAVAGQVFREAAEGVPVGQPPVRDIEDRARARRGRRNRWIGAVLVLGLAALALGTWFATRPPPDPLPEVTVRTESNPANIAWYADGVLHLARVTVEVGQVQQLVEVPDGVVYADSDDRVVLVDVDGRLTALGEKAPDTDLVGSFVRGWVAWLEPGSLPDLVVHDTVTRQEVARRAVAPHTTSPIAIDEDRLYFREHGDSWSWQLPDLSPVLVPHAELLDVAGAVRVQRGERGMLRIRQRFFASEAVVPGSDAVLSSDGKYVLTRADLGQPRVVRIYEGDGRRLASGIDDKDEVVVAAAFGPDDTITYVVGRREYGADGDEFLRLSESIPFDLRTCDLRTAACTDVTQINSEHGIPVLPTN